MLFMEINYIKGSRLEFMNFLDSISKEDRVAIMTHTDLDGLASGVFMEQIFKARGIPVEYIAFLGIGEDMVKAASVKLREKEISKVVFMDIGIDSIDYDGFRELREEMDVFLIDHHPMNEAIKDMSNIIKTDSRDCAAMVVFELGRGIIDAPEWDWLNCAAIFSDFSHVEEKNLKYIQSIYPDVTFDNISSTIPGINARKASSALIYYKHDIKYVYELVRGRKMDELTEAHEIIEEEIDRLVDDFSKNKQYYSDRNLYFYEVVSRFKVMSYAISLVSKMSPNDTFIFMFRDGNYVKFSGRNSNEKVDINALMKHCIKGLPNATGGGHKAASAARIRAEDLDLFKERLLE